MRTSSWKNYELIDASDGERLERWGDVILIRPDPQVIWKTKKNNRYWTDFHARYFRSKSGGGGWKFVKNIHSPWQISYKNLKFNLKTMSFKHTGVFPEQASNWEFLQKIIVNSNKKINILNLFAYTGGATLACLSSGANVCHVDSSKGMVFWAKENAKISGLSEKPIRWIVDDCLKFISKEVKRNKKYDGIIMDPPTYGRGNNGEIWKLESDLHKLIELCSNVLDNNPSFFMVNSYTTGLSPAIMEYLVREVIQKKFGGFVQSDEIGLPVAESGLVLPAGSTTIWTSKKLIF